MRYGAMKETFESLERAFKKFNIDFYLIGAFARDMWMDHLDDLPERRTTRDVDFSIHINKLEDFNTLKNYLQDEEGFSKDDEPYRLYAKDGMTVDLIPFGGIEENNMVYLDGASPMSLSVFGNMEVLSHAKSIQMETAEFKICTLPGLCILKLVSGHEKADRLNKDLGDFYYILENYFEIAGDLIYDGEFDDLIDEEFVPEIASAKMLGRQMKPILLESQELRDRIFAILDKLKQNFSEDEIDEMYKAEPKEQMIKRMKLLSVMHSQMR